MVTTFSSLDDISLSRLYFLFHRCPTDATGSLHIEKMRVSMALLQNILGLQIEKYPSNFYQMGIFCLQSLQALDTVFSGKQDGLISKLERKKSVLYSRLSNFYVGIRRFIFKFLVLYLRPSYNKGRLVFQRIR